VLTVSLETARRFILGKQGLWPGRRWRGSRGTEQAMRAMEHLQLDPLQIIARSQDIKLHSRVIDYTPGLWEDVTYRRRKFFDWGGWLAVRPMEELPHWRVLMRRERRSYASLLKIARDHARAIAEMRAVLRKRGTVSNRDFEMHGRTRTDSYRGRKDSALALYYLWRTGEVMVHHRERFERVYALTERVAPPHLIRESRDAECDDFMLKKMVSFYGLTRLNTAGWSLSRRVSAAELTRWREARLASGDLIEVTVEGWREPRVALGSDAGTLKALEAGRVPKAWTPLETTTHEETVFLAPLDIVSARGRAKLLFDFDYVWEVYKPVHERRWGYYTLPILWDDRLVARFDSKFDRTTNTLVILGFWPARRSLGRDEAFADAFARGLARFVAFLGASRLDAKAVQPASLRGRAADLIRASASRAS
jgi:uncharacterized protein YcaQ